LVPKIEIKNLYKAFKCCLYFIGLLEKTYCINPAFQLSKTAGKNQIFEEEKEEIKG